MDYRFFEFCKMKGSRGQTWSHDEVRCLLNIWSEKNMSQLLQKMHKNTEVFRIFSDKMKENGFQRSIEQCRVKVKKLRQNYMRSFSSSDVKDKFMWHDDLDRILNSRHKIQKTHNDKDGLQSANKTTAAQQNISKALPSASKYKSDSKEQQTKEEAIAKWIVRTGLPVTTIEDEDFVLMMETVDRRLTVPKTTKISNLIQHSEHMNVKEEDNGTGEYGRITCPFYEELDHVSDDRTIPRPISVMESATEEDMDAVVTPAPSVTTEGLNYVIKMEESPDDDSDIGSANPSSQPRLCIGHDEDTDPPAVPTLGDAGIGGVRNIRRRGRYDKRSNIQRVESQLSSLGERFLEESRREFEEMMSRDREWLEGDRLLREEQHRIWQQECQATIATLTQSLHRKPSSSSSSTTPSCGLLCGDLTQAGCGSMSPRPQMTQGWSCEEEETQPRPEVSRGVLIPTTTPPRAVSVPPAETPAPPAASQREVRRGAKRGRTPPPLPPPAALSVFQQGVLDALNKDIGEEEHFLLSLVPALKRLDNRKKSLVRLKFQQFLFDAEFSND